jgi:hypothetical protein
MSDKLFVKKILDLLPQVWRHRFNADRALEVFTLDDFIDMTYRFMPKENINTIMKLCIKASRPDFSLYRGNNPYDILNMLQYEGVKFDREMYKLARSDECTDSKRILSLFCDLPATKIQHVWLKYRQQKRNRAIQIIQKRVLEWLYRPDGPMMKKSEKNFNRLIMSNM